MMRAQQHHRGSNHKVLVLDMDETLITTLFEFSTPEEERAALAPLAPLADRLYAIQTRDIFAPLGAGVTGKMAAIERPYLQMFLAYVLSRFAAVIVWSAGQRNYVHRNVAYLTRWSGPVDAVYVFDDCATRPDGVLSKPLAHLMCELPWLTLQNTLIVDDRATAFIAENPANGILIPAYDPTLEALHALVGMGAPDPDTALLELVRYFESSGVLDAADVRTVAKPTFGKYFPGVEDIHTELRATNVAGSNEIGQAEVLVSPGQGDCLFYSILNGLRRQPILQVHAQERIDFRFATDDIYRQILSGHATRDAAGQRPSEDHHGRATQALNVLQLRALVASDFLQHPSRMTTYLEAHFALHQAAPEDPEVQWLRPALRDDGRGYRAEIFVKMVMDRRSYWGDGAALEIISDALDVEVAVWQRSNRDGQLKTHVRFTPRAPLGLIHVLQSADMSHYDCVVFAGVNFD